MLLTTLAGTARADPAVRSFAVGYGVGGVTTGADGALWFTIGGGVGRLTTSGRRHIFSVPQRGSPPMPGLIVAGSYGALWFTRPGKK